jgi:hypothetical protein
MYASQPRHVVVLLRYLGPDQCGFLLSSNIELDRIVPENARHCLLIGPRKLARGLSLIAHNYSELDQSLAMVEKYCMNNRNLREVESRIRAELIPLVDQVNAIYNCLLHYVNRR